MSRIGKLPIPVPAGVTVTIGANNEVTVKGPKGTLSRTLINNMVVGVTEGFKKELEINGVGYRAQMQGNKLCLTLGYSHPVEYVACEGVTIEVPAPNKIIVSGANKEHVGATAAKIREYRLPEPYKGKGIKYIDEVISRKEGKAGAKKK